MATRLTLRALNGRLRGRGVTFPSPGEMITLGRSSGCTVRLARDLTVSRRHCLIEVGEYGAWVQDLGSLNGTFVTGQKVRRRSPGSGGSTVLEPSRHALRDGDDLRV